MTQITPFETCEYCLSNSDDDEERAAHTDSILSAGLKLCPSCRAVELAVVNDNLTDLVDELIKHLAKTTPVIMPIVDFYKEAIQYHVEKLGQARKKILELSSL